MASRRKRRDLLKRRPWTGPEVARLRRLYPHEPTADIAVKLGRTLSAVYQRAQILGLHKSVEYLASPAAHRTDGRKGIGTRFPKGHVPANKGLRRPGWHRGRMRETQFKPGHRPHTWKPVGSYRVNSDGYLDRKVSDTSYPPRDWVGVHRLVWIEANGPVPPDHVVCFKPGRHSTEPSAITLDALELVHRRDLMARNTVHNLPKPLAQLVLLRGALNRQINARERALEEQAD